VNSYSVNAPCGIFVNVYVLLAVLYINIPLLTFGSSSTSNNSDILLVVPAPPDVAIVIVFCAANSFSCNPPLERLTLTLSAASLNKVLHYLVTSGVTVTIPSNILDTVPELFVNSASQTYLPADIAAVTELFRASVKVELAVVSVQVNAVELDDECVFLICEAAEYPVKFRLTPDESVKLIAVEKSVP